jgi:hypothetical protein
MALAKRMECAALRRFGPPPRGPQFMGSRLQELFANGGGLPEVAVNFKLRAHCGDMRGGPVKPSRASIGGWFRTPPGPSGS